MTMGFGIRQTRSQTLIFSIPNWVTLGKSVNLVCKIVGIMIPAAQGWYENEMRQEMQRV